MKTAILFTANDPQLAASHLMTLTLRAADRGAYDQDIWVLSTQLSEDARSYLNSLGINYLVSDMAWAEEEMNWQALFPDLPPKQALKEFHMYRNKRMSKIIYLEWFENFGSAYDAVAISDNDLYFQKDIRPLFDLAGNGRVNYSQEDYPIYPGTNLWEKDFWYRQHTGDWDFNGGLHEVNIGFIIARPDVMAELFTEIRNRFPLLPEVLIRDHAWHDQDITRVIRCQRPELFTQFPPNTLLHLCGGGMDLVEECRPGHFRNRTNKAVPAIVHFGGGAWKDFRSIAPSYTVASQDIFDDINQHAASGPLLALGKAELINEVVHLSGWYVSRLEDIQVAVATRALGAIGIAQVGLPRPDVTKAYPSRLNTCGGWTFSSRLPDLAPDDHIVITLMEKGRRRKTIKNITLVTRDDP